MIAGRVGILALIGAVLAACTSGSGSGPSRSDAPAPPASDEFTRPSSHADKSMRPATRTITGVLTFDDVEGGCASLESADGTRYEVVYPEGWTLDVARGELRSDDGRAIRAGDSLTVRGALATDRSSTCQIGPIFLADDVEEAGP